MAGRKGQEVARVHGEIVDPSTSEYGRPVQWPNAVSWPARTRDGQPVIVLREEHHHHAAAEVKPVAPSRLVPWALIALALVILAFACFASWHTWIGPQVDPVRPHPVDLVGPSR